jgi:hypothetical protein
MLAVHPDLHAVAQRCFEREQVSDTREAHARTVRRRIDYHLLPQLRQQKSSGDEILHNLNKSLDRFGYVRSKVQRQLHNAFLNAVAPFVYGDELQISSDRILAENNWTDWRLQTLALTPRRFGMLLSAQQRLCAHAVCIMPGKTTAVSMFCAACCLCVPDMVIAVFSTGRRASQMLLEQVLSMIRAYQENDPACTVKVVKSNMESVWLKSQNGDIRKVAQSAHTWRPPPRLGPTDTVAGVELPREGQ